MGIPWDGMGWDRHELLWNGMGWDRKICPMDKPAKFSSSKISLQKQINLDFFIFFGIFELQLNFYAQFYLILNFSNSCNGKNACGN